MKGLKSWKTTAAGIVGGLALIFPELAALLDNDPETVMNVKVIMTGLGMLGVGWFSRDNDKSSEDVGNANANG